MPARRFTDEQEKEICKLYAGGKSSIEIGKIYNCSYRTIFNVLKRNKVESRGVENNRGEIKISAHKRRLMCKEYQGGKPVDRLARDHQVSKAAVYEILKSGGVFVPFQNSEHRIYEHKRELVCKEYQSGKAISDLARDHQVEEQSIRKILRGANLLIEPPKALTIDSLPPKVAANKRTAKKSKADPSPPQAAKPKRISPITEEVYKECARRYEKGESVASISRKLGFSSHYLYAAFKQNGVQVKRYFNKPTKKEYDQMVEDYLAGKSVQEIASSMGLSISPVYAELRRRRIKPPGNALGAEKEREICQLYINGKTTIEISRKLSVHPSTANKILKKHEIKARPQELFSDEDANVILELYEEGYTTYHLAEIFDCHSTTIQDSIRRIGGELRESRGYQDTVQQAINGEKRFFGERETSFYVYDLSRFPGYLKPGIAFDIGDRADESKGEYGEVLLQMVFACRQAAFMLEQAILFATLDCSNCPEQLIDWEGATEVRKIGFEDLEPLIDFYESELDAMGIWSFAAAYVPMTLAEKRQCLQLAEAERTGSDVVQS